MIQPSTQKKEAHLDSIRKSKRAQLSAKIHSVVTSMLNNPGYILCRDRNDRLKNLKGLFRTRSIVGPCEATPVFMYLHEGTTISAEVVSNVVSCSGGI